MSNPRYYDPIGRSIRALFVIALLCFAGAFALFVLDIVTPGTISDPDRPLAGFSEMLIGLGIVGLIIHYATAAIVGAIRGRGQ
ncbi:hypothetical protein HQQ81_08415 [Microbacteriaceae bacterium VKM Ac-2854]|nr:hypothetical protein [Microbacteriaceae bacterium VKM Ac-2854]